MRRDKQSIPSAQPTIKINVKIDKFEKLFQTLEFTLYGNVCNSNAVWDNKEYMEIILSEFPYIHLFIESEIPDHSKKRKIEVNLCYNRNRFNLDCFAQIYLFENSKPITKRNESVATYFYLMHLLGSKFKNKQALRKFLQEHVYEQLAGIWIYKWL